MEIINLFVKPSPESREAHRRVEAYFEDHGFAISRLYNEKARYNIVIGGDGSFLRAVHSTHFSSIPFLGINTGHLGFFQEITLSDLEEYLELLRLHRYEIHHQDVLCCTVETTAWTYRLLAVNEFLISSNDDHILHLNVGVDGVDFINSSGDGLMLSTPAGSTAYNLSAGGSILHQMLRGYQITALHPVRSKSFDSLPSSLVLPAESKTVLTIDGRDAERIKLICDGVKHAFRGVKRLTFSVPEERIQRIIFRSNWYWKNLRDKLF
ncbi:NAD(+)/NADH kinase [Levyella massiliensis]|uniref:NAD(+)/NADH kinase n=1 Tax=Levyella massiliensis TaxID=938289 RepID=UPI00037E6AF4|nr:NAD(+)/NADH kinase [Levyella massiliensis]